MTNILKTLNYKLNKNYFHIHVLKAIEEAFT